MRNESVCVGRFEEGMVEAFLVDACLQSLLKKIVFTQLNFSLLN